MLTTTTAIKGKIAEKVAELHQCFYNKQFTRAKHIYDSIHATVCMLEFTPAEASEIFGNRAYKADYEEETQGLLNSYIVSRVFLETGVKSGSSETMELYKCANCPLKVKK